MIEQETANRRTARLEQKSESETVREIPPDSGRLGIGSALSPRTSSRTEQSDTESTDLRREFENTRDALTRIKLPNQLKDWYKKGGPVHV